MKWPVLNYSDKAIAFLGKNLKGKMSITKIELRPKITFKENFRVSHDQMSEIQDISYRYCFVANTISEEVKVQINF